MAARQTVAVLAAHAAAEFDHEIGDLIRYLFHDANVSGILGVDHLPDVETSDARMTVIPRICSELVDHAAESHEEVGQLHRIDGTVFNKRNRLSVAFHPQQQPQSRL